MVRIRPIDLDFIRFLKFLLQACLYSSVTQRDSINYEEIQDLVIQIGIHIKIEMFEVNDDYLYDNKLCNIIIM